LQAQYVVVPPGAEAQFISCPICKEALKSEFLEDDEEWVWRNAVKKDDKVRRIDLSNNPVSYEFQIFHATCHAEALASTSNLAARLRLEKAHGSRSATPEVHLMTGIQSTLRLTPPSAQLRKSRSQSPSQASPESKVAGIKRKVENTDSNLTREANGTPPYKRVALPMLSIQSS
jgi:pre-mRNA cleavage complex 2 protein Pcf11